mmetsp:Transcript_63584/g.113150  ORF Transcript_63584/g.113150 Transcript_63584/m.113150 type:complete len:255 (+) Transcript_63584:1034-1798(+)
MARLVKRLASRDPHLPAGHRDFLEEGIGAGICLPEEVALLLIIQHGCGFAESSELVLANRAACIPLFRLCFQSCLKLLNDVLINRILILQGLLLVLGYLCVIVSPCCVLLQHLQLLLRVVFLRGFFSHQSYVVACSFRLSGYGLIVFLLGFALHLIHYINDSRLSRNGLIRRQVFLQFMNFLEVVFRGLLVLEETAKEGSIAVAEVLRHGEGLLHSCRILLHRISTAFTAKRHQEELLVVLVHEKVQCITHADK